LDSWKLPRVSAAREVFQPVFKWAAAAAVVLAVGFGIGRITSARANVEFARAAIEPEIRKQMRQEFEAVYSALEKIDAQRVADTLSLKTELDIVAVNTDAGLRHTEQQLVQLADYTQPVGLSKPPKE
jgi:cobalamin biosynthesis protein CbiD